MSDDNEKPTWNPEHAPTTDPCDVPEGGNGGDKDKSLILSPPEQPKIILPSSGADEILPGDPFTGKLKLDDKTLAELGVKSEADLGDDIDLERSPIDGACVISAKKGGVQVCYYCFKPFMYGGIPEYAPAEIEVTRPDGTNQGIRCKVHGRCQLRKMQGLPIED